MLRVTLGQHPATIEILKDTVQDCNINFLIGSGLSCPFLRTLGNIEALLSSVDTDVADAAARAIIRASLYKTYFDGVILPNAQIVTPTPACQTVLNHYKHFLDILNSILLRRKVTLLSKEVNLFTTHIDVFLDKALEEQALQYNDGFNGRFKPLFSLSNFKTSRFKRSLFYDKSAELPVFNLVKLHGSVSWSAVPGCVAFSHALDHIQKVADNVLTADHVVDVPPGANIAALVTAAAAKKADAVSAAFVKGYEELLIVVNPTKDKFKHTLMNETYYELLRMYSNELEKENTVLFSLGFSFADEHIRDITLRAANSNPTLTILIFAHTSAAAAQIDTHFATHAITNQNIRLVVPEQEDDGHGGYKDKFSFDFEHINSQVFGALLRKIESEG